MNLKKTTSSTKIKYFILASFLFLNSGCLSYLYPHNIRLDPQISASPRTVDNEVAIILDIQDERLDTALGHQFRMTHNAKGMPIYTNQNIHDVVKNSLISGLKKMGFVESPKAENNLNILRVELRHLNSFVLDEPFGQGHIYTQAAFKTYCMDTKSKINYENFFRAQDVADLWTPPNPSENQEFINKTLSKTLNKIFQDKNLFECLATDRRKLNL